MDGAHIVETADPEAAFSILADATRIEILRALWEADGQTASFSDLREAVGVRDSGKFNYHLGKLTGRFVEKSDEGYTLRTAGQNVVGSLLAGTYTVEAAIDPIELDESCPFCEGALTFDYVDERGEVDCESCPFDTSFPVPPGAFADCPVERFPQVADRYLKTLLIQAKNGFCAACEGRVDPQIGTFDELGSIDPPTGFDENVVVVYDCDRCGAGTQVNLATIMLEHPVVAGFHYELGTDVTRIPVWQLGTVDGEPQSTLLEDGSGARVTYVVGDARLTVTVDRSLEVVDVDRDRDE